MEPKKGLSARFVFALVAIGLGVVILAACADSSNDILGVMATPTVDSGPAATATAVERLIRTAVAATVVELRIQTQVAATVKAARTATAAAYTVTPTATATPASTETTTPTATSVVVRDPLLGVGIHPWKEGHSPTLEEINELGIGWVRFVAYADHLAELGDVLANFDRFGVKVILVVNQETLPRGGDENIENYTNRFSSEFAQLVSTHGSKVAAWEVWNEPEDGGLVGKHLSREDYLTLLERCFDRAKVVSPETMLLGSGYAEFVNADRLRCDGYAYHVYGQRFNGFPENYHHAINLEAVHNQTGVPLWITEFGAPLEDFTALGGDPEEWQAKYLTAAVQAFRQSSFVKVACYFGWVDLNNEEKSQAYGLLNSSFKKRKAYETFGFLTEGH